MKRNFIAFSDRIHVHSAASLIILCLAEPSHYELHHKQHETSHYELHHKQHKTVAEFPRTLYSKEWGCINETNYYYSIISPPILVANLIGKKGVE